MSLQRCKIKDLGIVLTGNTPPTSKREYYGDIYPFIKPTDMRVDSRYIGNTEERLSEQGYKLFQTKLLPKDTTCVVTIGTIGKLCLTKEPSFCNQAVNSIIVDRNLFDPLYIFYLMKLTIPKVKFLSSGTASGRENVSKSAFENIDIEVLPLLQQRKVANILSAYDHLIENNTRRIKILEEMARSLYDEWFVKFRFPGHKQTKLINSELGLIPEDWEIRKITTAVLINPKTQVPKEGEKPFIPMSSLSNDSMLISNIESRSGNSGSKFKNGDTLFARITPCLENGKTGYVQFLNSGDSVAFGSTEFIVLRSQTLCPEYVYLMARSNEFRDNAIKSMTGATGRQRVQEACFDRFLIAHPDKETISNFSNLVSPIFHNIYLLSRKNVNLRQTRDLLLPKLISGEIDVEKLDGMGGEEAIVA